MANSITISFLGALQASLAVLLTMLYGLLTTRFNLWSESSAKDISRTCVRVFLPALLITKLGKNLHLDTASNYVPLFLWAIVYNVVSMGMGFLFVRVFKLPSWVTPAITFNNTTSLPLLLVQALEATGILEGLLMSPSDSMSDAVDRAQSYFLVNAMVGNALTFAIGPMLLTSAHEEDTRRRSEGKPDDEEELTDGLLREQEVENAEEDAGENASLLASSTAKKDTHVKDNVYSRTKGIWDNLPPWLRASLRFLYAFCNAPMIGALIGVVVGLTPPLHIAFFAQSNQGGYMNAWLTKSIQNVGGLFAGLQVLVVGVKLGGVLGRMQRGEASGEVPWSTVLVVTLVRYVFWAAVGVPLFWALAARTSVLGDDPILWFVLMLAATGPPAMKLTALADVEGSTEDEKMSIAKVLALSYMISPLICFPVVGSLKAAEAAKKH